MTLTQKNYRCVLVVLFSLLSLSAHAKEKNLNLWERLKEIAAAQHQIASHTQAVAQTAKSQLRQLKKQWSDLTRTYGMSDSVVEQQARLWSANDWQSLLRQVAGGNAVRFQQLLSAYQKQYPTIHAGKATISGRALSDATYTQQGQTYRTALAASEYTFDSINPRIQRLEALLHSVDNPHKNKNEKAAIDLNSRISAELGFIQLEALKLHSIQTHVEATHDQGGLNQETLDRQFTHYQPPTEEVP